MTLTDPEKATLMMLNSGPRLADFLGDLGESILPHLKDEGFVRQAPMTFMVWEITDEGREALKP